MSLRPPSCSALLLDLARAQNREMRRHNAALQSQLDTSLHENHALRDELAMTHTLLDEALSAAAAALGRKQQQPQRTPPTPLPDVPIQNATMSGRTRVRDTRSRGAKQSPKRSHQAAAAAERERRERMARECAARAEELQRMTKAVAVLQARSRGMIVRDRLRQHHTEEWAVLQLQSLVRGNVARAIADRRRFAYVGDEDPDAWQ